VSRKIRITGYRFDKAGKVVPCDKHLNVSLRLKQRSSKRVRAGKRVTVAKPTASTV